MAGFQKFGTGTSLGVFEIETAEAPDAEKTRTGEAEPRPEDEPTVPDGPRAKQPLKRERR